MASSHSSRLPKNQNEPNTEQRATQTLNTEQGATQQHRHPTQNNAHHSNTYTQQSTTTQRRRASPKHENRKCPIKIHTHARNPTNPTPSRLPEKMCPTDTRHRTARGHSTQNSAQHSTTTQHSAHNTAKHQPTSKRARETERERERERKQKKRQNHLREKTTPTTRPSSLMDWAPYPPPTNPRERERDNNNNNNHTTYNTLQTQLNNECKNIQLRDMTINAP